MELSKLYEQVTAVREDARVRHPSDPAYTLRYGPWGGRDTASWYFAKCDAQHDDNPFNICPVVDFLAEAAIGWHWLGLLTRAGTGSPADIQIIADHLLATAKEAK